MTKNWIAYTAVLFTSLFIWVSTVFAAPRIGIVDFEDSTQYPTSWHLGQYAADMLTRELVKNAKWLEIYERDRILHIAKKQDFGESNRFAPSAAAEIGRLIGLDYIVIGAVTEFGVSNKGGGVGVHIGKKSYHAAVDVRVVDVRSETIVFADSGEGHKRSTSVRVFGFGGGERNNTKNETATLRKAIKDVAKKIGDAELGKNLARGASSNSLANYSPNAVLIANIDGNSVTLSKGAKADLRLGRKYKIQRQKGLIKDPSTGQVIKVLYSSIGEVQITTVEAHYADGKLLSNNGVAVGDEVSIP